MDFFYKITLFTAIFLFFSPLFSSEFDLEMQKEMNAGVRSLNYATTTGLMALTAGGSSLVCLSNFFLDVEKGRDALDSDWLAPTVLLLSFSGTCIISSLGCLLRYEKYKNVPKDTSL